MNRKYKISWRYIAGFFDGEGCIYNNTNGNSICVQLTQKRKRVLNLIAKFLRLNDFTIYQINKCGEMHHLRLYRQQEVLRFLENISYFSIVKIDEIEHAIDILRNKYNKYYFSHTKKEQIKELMDMGHTAKKVKEHLHLNCHVNSINRIYRKIKNY